MAPMQRIAAFIAGLALVILAGTASAQWRTSAGHDGQAPRGFPPMHDQQEQPAPRNAGPRGPQQPGRWPQVFPNDSLGAGWSPQQDAVRAGVRQKLYVPLGQAIESIRRRGPGRELDAGLEQWQGRPAYRVRWAEPDGRRIDYMVDAESGAILGVDEGH
jgi:peptidase YpeB-like protein